MSSSSPNVRVEISECISALTLRLYLCGEVKGEGVVQ